MKLNYVSKNIFFIVFLIILLGNFGVFAHETGESHHEEKNSIIDIILPFSYFENQQIVEGILISIVWLGVIIGLYQLSLYCFEKLFNK